MNVTTEWVAQQAAKAACPVTEGWKDGALTVFVPGTPTHFKGKGHRFTVSKHTKDWRERTATHLLRWIQRQGGPVPRYGLDPGVPPWVANGAVPKRITFTVYTSGRGFDGVDNLKLVCSPALDALGPARSYLRGGVEVRGHGMGLIDDDKNPAHQVTYDQVVKAPVVGIAIRVELAPPSERSEAP